MDDKAEVERSNAPSSVIPPPMSPPPQLDPEDRRRKIAALKVQHVHYTTFASIDLTVDEQYMLDR